MKLIVEVIVNVHTLEGDVDLSVVQAAVAATQGLGEALRHAENRGFNHMHSDWVGIVVEALEVRATPVLHACSRCGDWIQIKKQGRASQNEWYCDVCAEELPEEPTKAPCKFCQILVLLDEAHRHDDGWVCAGCWDERLRNTE